MLASPFAFLRGSAAVMAADLADTPVTGLSVQACGDAHLANFGVFASAERNLVFAINDFDETLPGPWEWDLKRLAASIFVAGRFLGADASSCEDAVRAAVRSYRKHMREYARMSHLDVWYSRIGEKDILDAISPGAREDARRIMAKARRRNHLQVLGKMAELVDDQHHIVEYEAADRARDAHGRRAIRSPRPSTTRCTSTSTRCPRTARCCSRATAWSTSRARSWAWAASAPAAGSCCSRATTTRIRCSSSTRRRSDPSSRPT